MQSDIPPYLMTCDDLTNKPLISKELETSPAHCT